MIKSLSLIFNNMARAKNKKKNNFSIVDKIVLILNGIAVALLLLSYLAPIVDPRDFTIIAILGFGYLALLATNCMFIIYWAVRFKIFFLISALSILLGFKVLTANFGFNFQKQVARAEANIHMMAYNVHGFVGIDSYEGDSIHAGVLDLVNDYQPDILNFEEFSEERNPNRLQIIDSVKKVLKTEHYFFKSFSKNRRQFSGNAIFTKFPIIDTGVIPTPGFFKIRSIFVDLRYGKKTLRVYSVHLTAVNIQENEKRRYLNGKLNVDNSTFIRNRLNSAFVLRSLEVSVIKKHMAKCPYPYIVAGDFNDTPNSFAVNTLSDGLKNTFIEKGNGLGATYYSKFSLLHIDYILTSPQFDVVNYQVIEKKLSDHKPIISELILR